MADGRGMEGKGRDGGRDEGMGLVSYSFKFKGLIPFLTNSFVLDLLILIEIARKFR
jgi:hypothetical protein